MVLLYIEAIMAIVLIVSIIVNRSCQGALSLQRKA